MIIRDIFGGAPLLRPLAALIAGIILAKVQVFILLSALSLAVAAVLFFLIRKPLYVAMGKSLLLSVLFVGIGILVVKIQDVGRPLPFPSDSAVYECRLLTDSYFKGKTYRCHAEVLGRMDTVATGAGAKAILYFADSVPFLRKGDRLYVRTSMSMPNFSQGYREYLLRNNVCGTGYVANGEYHLTGHDAPSGLLAFAADCQRAAERWYASIGFQGDELAILSALTVGLRDAVSDELNKDYSISGLAHVLALSGLHVGLIFFVLQLLLRPLARIPGGGVLSWVILSAALFAFAVFTGLSSPVIRACFMMSAFGFTVLTRRGTSLNALCLVALVMLMVDYRYVYDVSFQMSFTAVLFILLFYWRIASQFNIKNRVLRYLKDLFVISSVAQAGVVPIIASTFGTFSLYGVVASVIVVPFLSLLMYVAVVMVLLFWLQPLVPFFVIVVSSGLKAMNAAAAFFSGLPFASIGMEFDAVDCFFCYATVIAFFYWLQTRLPSRFRLTMIFAMWWACYSFLGQVQRSMRQELVFSNTMQGTSCTFVDGFDEYVFDTSLSDTATTSGGGFLQTGQAAAFNGIKVLRVDTTFYGIKAFGDAMAIDYVWLCRGARGHIGDLSQALDIGTLVLDASLTPYYRSRYIDEADSIGLPVIDMARTMDYLVGLR